jgi:hypothetical protein
MTLELNSNGFTDNPHTLKGRSIGILFFVPLTEDFLRHEAPLEFASKVHQYDP